MIPRVILALLIIYVLRGNGCSFSSSPNKWGIPIGECATTTMDFVEENSSYIVHCNSTNQWYYFWDNVTNCQPSTAYAYQSNSGFNGGYIQCKSQPACNIGKVTQYYNLNDADCVNVYSMSPTDYNFTMPMVLNMCINSSGNVYESEGIWYRMAKCDYVTNTVFVYGYGYGDDNCNNSIWNATYNTGCVDHIYTKVECYGPDISSAHHYICRHYLCFLCWVFAQIICIYHVQN